MRPKALDLFCGAGGMSVGLERAGFEVTAVDIRPLAKHHRGGVFVQADALTFPLEGFDFIHASPPCQAHSALRALHPGREYPDHIAEVRERLQASGARWSVENVPGAPLGGAFLVVLCGTMFGLVTPDGSAEIRRHRLFELSFCPARRPPPCRHGGGRADGAQGRLFEVDGAERDVLTVVGTGLDNNRERHARRALSVTGHTAEISPTNWGERKVLTVTGHTPVDNTRPGRRRAMSVTGETPQTNAVRNQERTTFSAGDARAAMGIDWMSMKYLSQAIPPAYGEWIGRQAMEALRRA